MLGAIYGAVLTSSTAKRYHEVLETAREVFLYRVVDDAVNMGEKLLHSFFIVEEGDDGLVTSGELLVFVVSSRVEYGSAVKDEAATITAGIVGYATTV